MRGSKNQSLSAGNSSSKDTLDLLCKGCAQVISKAELAAKLELGRPLRVKLGVDPTAPDIHLGHTVGLRKLRQFQDAGHQAILIIGDFTAMIGDPSGRSATRPQLTHDEVMANAKTYQEQAYRILDPAKTRIRFNGEWFEALSFEEVIQLNSRVTLQQMLQREDFKSRIDQGHPIRAHEIQYPIMQGWDSVMIKSDIEIGGTDQLFNILVGRDLQKEENQPQQVALMLPILEGTDGEQKMSKSLGNSIGVHEPAGEMFGKLMSIPDAVMANYYLLLLGEELDADAHPMEAKKSLARKIVADYHSDAAATSALEDFNTRFSAKDLSSADLPKYAPTADDFVSVVHDAYLKVFDQKRTKSEIRRLMAQGSIQWRGEKVTDVHAAFPKRESGILRLDKRRAVRVGD